MTTIKTKNPLAHENFIQNIKRNFMGKQKIYESMGYVSGDLLGMNDAVSICAEACSCCWDVPLPKTYEDQCRYVEKRVAIGHSSIIEHSNFVIHLKIESNISDEIIDLLENSHYLYSKSILSLDGNFWHMIIGGSFRAWSDLFREVGELNTPVMNVIKNLLYTYAPWVMFADLCKMGILDKDSFKNLETPEEYRLTQFKLIGNNEKFDIIAMDNYARLFNNLQEVIGQNLIGCFQPRDLIKFLTCTVLFKNMSRTGTHQLVRHRNAITQESQRYVDYSQACFANPADFKPDLYDKDHKYKVWFGERGGTQTMTLGEIGDAISAIYSQLSSSELTGNFKLLKEDARAFLPSNIQCRKIYITFTWRNLIKFLELRTDKAAQAEIRSFAVPLLDAFMKMNDLHDEQLKSFEDYANLLKPRILIENSSIEEVVE